MRKIIAWTVVCMLVSFGLAACSGGGTSPATTTVGNLKPGTLRFSQMTGLGNDKASKSLRSSSTFTTSFDLGTIKASRDFYFLLSNGGDVPVTNIVISSSNANFTVSPQTIDSISPQNDASVTPVVRVSVLHGIALDGTGFSTSLLPISNNTCSLTLTGKTTDQNNNAVDISVVVNLSVFADVMDISITDNNSDINLLNPTGNWGSNLANDVPIYICNSPALKNTGNVAISVTNYNNDFVNNYPILEQFTLQPAESRNLSFPGTIIILKMESNNTITNYSKLKLKADGSVWLLLQKNP